ncbi:nucleotide sugar dehydrogenase [Rhodothermus marinus]|uniref:Nucleotide sugar dehydrogenase n=1 Tax=Rhodothermus marinus (strain ATCC 43812 / DSM 4252 / R-10) TaxID=518766 RepID=D0MJA3_RHOM4|nr:nucleotide sugar dehydrogenase [Rhodothermus marinus]ACY48561.1 nucleotide sugar dehydrogenase [Rhodothermus marinus DSM 4252]
MESLVVDKATLLERIRTKEAVVGVVGLGYVGLPFAVEKAKVGYRVIGIEQNPRRAEKINRGENYIRDVRDEELRHLVAEGRIVAETDFNRVPEMDVVVICVPTPLTKNLTPDLQYVERVTHEIGRRLRPGQLISLESTTYPGTTEEVMLPILEGESGLKVERDFFLAHSPERVDPGNQRYTTKNTSKVVGGVGPESLEVAVAFYSQTIEHVVPVSSAKAAELVKVFENTFRAVNIALVNELALLCDRMGLNVWEVLEAAFTKPFGIMPFWPGPGVGGHCIPVDPHYLEWKAKELNFNTHFIALAGEINRKMPEFVREKAYRVLNRLGVAPSRARVLLLGVAYKRDLEDWRESPALEVLRLLEADGVAVRYHDPYVPEVQVAGRTYRSVPLTQEAVAGADLVIITTDHSTIDYRWVVEQARAVLDTRYATRGIESEKIVLL